MSNIPEGANNTTTVKDVFNVGWSEYLQLHTPDYEKQKVANSIMNCRTKVLGGHIHTCKKCGYQQNMYNSCQNRHCPECEKEKSLKWVEKTIRECLPVKHAHLTLNLPDELRHLTQLNQEIVYNSMFKAFGKAMELFGAFSGGKLGVISILHTWGQQLQFHPHLHASIPLGVYNEGNGKFIEKEINQLLPLDKIKGVFKDKLLSLIEKNWKEGQIKTPREESELESKNEFQKFIRKLKGTQWHAHIDETEDVSRVIGYIGKHKHSVAIKNEQIIKIEDGKVYFRGAVYGDTYNGKIYQLSIVEFIKRYLMHVLPRRLNKLRKFGLEHHKNKQIKNKCYSQLHNIQVGNSVKMEDETIIETTDIPPCPMCGCCEYTSVMVEKRNMNKIYLPERNVINREVRKE